MESLTEVILITLFIWAGVAMIKKGSRKKQVQSCHVYVYLSFPLQRFFSNENSLYCHHSQ